MDADLKRTVEALLFAAPEPLSLSRMQAILPRCDRRALREVLAELARQYDEGGHAFELLEIGGGWRIVTRPEHARRIEELLKGQRRVRLSRAALECLAVVAYRQPCTRVDVESVRGVNCGGSLATLMERGLLRITGRAETLGRPLLYGTTEEFLGHLGINALTDLPQLAEIEALLRPRPVAGGPVTTLALEEEGGIPAAERRERLVAGMERIAELIADSAVLAAAAGNGNGNGHGAEPAGEDEILPEEADLAAAEAPPEHGPLLAAERENERELLAEVGAPDVAEEAAAAAAGSETLALIARALDGGEAAQGEEDAGRDPDAKP